MSKDQPENASGRKPRRCGMPDLSDLDIPMLANYQLNMVFHRAGARDWKASAYLVNFIRATDRGVQEYREARQLLARWVRGGTSLMTIFSCCDHLESCITVTSRAVRYLEKMRRYKKSPHVPRLTDRLVRSTGKPIPDIRNTLEHMDEEIGKDTFEPGWPIALRISDDGDEVSVGGYRISFADLATTLRSLHDFASELARYREP